MPAAAPPDTSPVPIVTPPKLPTTTDKSIAVIAILVGGMLGAAGTFYSTQVATDPETKEAVGTNVDIGAILTAISGAVVTIGGVYKGLNNTKKSEDAAIHATTTANAAVAIAATSPPIGSDGQMTVETTLRSALSQAAQDDRLEDGKLILDLLRQMKGGAA